MNLTINYSMPVLNNPMTEKLTCEDSFQEYLNSTSDTLNLYVVVLFFSYALLMFLTQYLLEKKIVTITNYVKIHFWVNNVMFSLAIIYFIYALLLL